MNCTYNPATETLTLEGFGMVLTRIGSPIVLWHDAGFEVRPGKTITVTYDDDGSIPDYIEEPSLVEWSDGDWRDCDDLMHECPELAAEGIWPREIQQMRKWQYSDLKPEHRN